MKRSQRKKRRQVSVPVASMGDIAFLLIIFFMVCSEMVKEKTPELTLPDSEHVDVIEDQIAARVAVDETGKVFLDGRAVGDAESVKFALEQVLEKTVSDKQRHVQFKCHDNLARDEFEPILKAIAEAGGIIEAVGQKPE